MTQVWCLAMRGTFVRLAKDPRQNVDNEMQAFINAAQTNIQQLFDLVEKEARNRKKGFAARFGNFCNTEEFLKKAKQAEKEVQKALDMLMFRSVRNPQPSTPNYSTSTHSPQPSPLAPHPSTPTTQPSSPNRHQGP